MKVSELYEQVAQLGFEDSLESDKRFYYALNRAILQVNTLRPATKVIEINHSPLKNMIGNNTAKAIEKISDLYFEAEKGVAYYFEADGEGIAYIEMYDHEEWRMIGQASWNSAFGFISKKDFIKADGEFIDSPIRLHFTGEYVYSVRNVAIYGALRSSQIDQIPSFSQYVAFDMPTLADDFLEFSAPPIFSAEYELLNTEYFIESNKTLFLSRSVPGVYKISYKKKPATVQQIDEAQKFEIDLDEELCSLLPVLIAAYIWADDEPEKAQYYLTLYRERAAIIEAKKTDISPVIIANKNGW